MDKPRSASGKVEGIDPMAPLSSAASASVSFTSSQANGGAPTITRPTNLRASNNKKHVSLTTFDVGNGDEDGSIKAAREAYWKIYAHQLLIGHPIGRLYDTPASLVQTINNGSSHFVYSAYAVAPSTPAQPIVAQLNAVTELLMISTVKSLEDDEKRKEREAKIDEKFDMLASSAIQANEKGNYAIGLGELAVEKSKYAVKRSDFAVEQTERFEARLQTEVADTVRKEMNDRLNKHDDDEEEEVNKQLFFGGKFDYLICSDIIITSTTNLPSLLYSPPNTKQMRRFLPL